MLLIEIERHMLFSGLNKSKLARMAGISPQRMHTIFRGANITIKTLGKICLALGVNITIKLERRDNANRS